MPVEFRQICVLAVQESVMLSRAAEKRSTSFKTDPQPGMATLMEVELPSKESTPLQSAQKQPRIEKFQELSHESDQSYSGLLDIGPSEFGHQQESSVVKVRTSIRETTCQRQL